ncbi:acyltransferase family protein [Oxalobacter aliiformigenes]|uniref:Acyltransferase family protein n=1 Tax=Oxalobacter aliiformigenes TaxID=2946593 RepID=A0A9E9NS96_9BURK|nr:acyltransferase family protein [Oxalobacter aliiformigenes]WAV90433.1 acyltransferase family protein [Oxalobacter aliiformigenes]
MNIPALPPKMDIRKTGEGLPPQKRDEITDIAKGIGILLVVAWHCDIGFMAGVDIPLFFFISGFFAPTLAKCPFAEGLKRKSVDLLKPTFLYVILFGVLAFILCRLPEVSPALSLTKLSFT